MENQRLTNGIIQDLITDIKFSRRKVAAGMNTADEAAYIDLCTAQLHKVWGSRRDLKLDRNGWPKVLTPSA